MARKTIPFGTFCVRQAKLIQKELRTENEFKYRDPRQRNYDLHLYEVCEELIRHAADGGDAGKCLSERIGQDIANHKAWLTEAEKKDDFTGMPPGYWNDIGLRIAVACQLATGELTEEDLEKAARDAMGGGSDE